jgi:hypothetical protein
MTTVLWLEKPQEHDYAAAEHYLRLLATPQTAHEVAHLLKTVPVHHQQAKDILRASNLPLLAHDNAHVRSDLHKIRTGIELSPILLVRGHALDGISLIIADGYHRVCASYYIDENTDIPCHLADWFRRD